MSALAGVPVTHSYVVATHRVRCDAAGPTRSTKHASGVTCPTCRALLRELPRSEPGLGGPSGATLPR